MDIYNSTLDALQGNFISIPFKVGDKVVLDDEDPEDGHHVVSGIRFTITYSTNKTEATYEYLLDNIYGYRVYSSEHLKPYVEVENESPTEE